MNYFMMQSFYHLRAILLNLCILEKLSFLFLKIIMQVCLDSSGGWQGNNHQILINGGKIQELQSITV